MRYRRVPHRRTRKHALLLPVLRSDACHGPLLRQSPLSDMSAGQDQRVARDAEQSLVAVPLLPGHLHAARGAAHAGAELSAQVYSALFEASSQTLCALAADPRFVGTDRIGFLGVLHTWGRTLKYHPHIRCVVSGGGISANGAYWLPSWTDFFVPVKALLTVFRAKFRDALRREGLLDQADLVMWSRNWVVQYQAMGDSRASVHYLAPYVFRVAIGNHRIVSCDDGRVTFTYRRVGSNRPRKMTLDAHEFLRRFLQHIVPAGFQKVRHYGFQSPNSETVLEAVRESSRWLLGRSSP